MSLLVLVKDRKFIFKNYLHAIPFYVVALIFGLITLGTQSEAISDSDSFTFFDRLTLGFWANARYLYRFFAPGYHSTMHPIPSEMRSIFYVGWSVMLAFVGVLIASRRTGKK